jgi:hypothetical protein
MGANQKPETPMPPLSRRRFLTRVAAACLGAPRFAEAARDQGKLEIVVDNGGWGRVSTADIRGVLLSTAAEIWPYCAGESLKPIRVYHRDDFPITEFVHDWRGRIRIGLHTFETHWAQMSFQFGHEFCHALAQHTSIALRGWHPPQHANLWFEESLCETGSLFVLRRLAVSWQQQTQSEAWRTFAPAMAKYAADRLALPEHQLPADTPFAAWFRANEPALRADPRLREKNVIVARQMLPLFEAEPAGWDAVCYLNLGAHQQGKPLAQHLAEWQNNSPAALHPFVAKIAALFPAAQAPPVTASSL